MISTAANPDVPETNEDKIAMLGFSLDNFGRSLHKQYMERGSLSPKQWYYVDVILERAKNPVPAEVPADNLHGLMASAPGRYPKIRMNTDNGKLVISRAGANARFPGSLNLTDGRPFGDNEWYGRIVTGIFQTSKKCASWVVAIVQGLESDPEGTAANYGRLSGNCCFCGRDLEDERSTSVGYGPVCADKWGLAWG